ncbi:O-antigen ligase family protein [Endozoicomonas lisbonensis]|uniref:O-antigen ligase n=1 Tax=Endozoicomonas lisbonensis TaxID=3120522 RepID=A0ABV2SMN2_9GAMM
MLGSIHLIRSKVSEVFCWYFFLFLLFISVFIDNGKAVVNFYRVWVCIPVLLCVRWSDIKGIVNVRFVQYFLALTVWLSLSLLWSDSDKLHNMAAKILATTALLFMIGNLVAHQNIRLIQAEFYYIGSALVLIVMIYLKWGYLGNDYSGNPLGSFGYYNLVAWFLSAAAIVALSLICNKPRKSTLWLLVAAFIVLLTSVVMFKSRGALLGLLTGCTLLITRLYWTVFVSLKGILYVLVVSTSIFLLFTLFIDTNSMTVYVSDLLSRADAGRFLIYENAYKTITESISTLLFGHGIAADPGNIVWRGMKVAHWHSIYVSTLFFGGLVGLLLFLLCVFKRPYEIYIKKAKPNSWDFVVMGMMVTLMFDGNRIYEYPGGMLLAFTLPLFLANFIGSRETQSQSEA